MRIRYFCAMQQKIVITGGPGSGKSTIINELSKKKFICIEEISREVTLKARQKGIEQLFLSDPLLFSNLLLESRITQYKETSKTKAPVLFFDRAIPDISAYLNFSKTPIPNTFKDANTNYPYTAVFILPPWKTIYTTDNERYESYEEAVAIHKHLLETYTNLGYTPIEVPPATPLKRTEFILKKLNLKY